MCKYNEIKFNEGQTIHCRPYTSIKCVFQGDTKGPGSLLDYSAGHIRKYSDELQNSVYLESPGSKNGKHRGTAATPHYTVAVSNIESPCYDASSVADFRACQGVIEAREASLGYVYLSHLYNSSTEVLLIGSQ